MGIKSVFKGLNNHNINKVSRQSETINNNGFFSISRVSEQLHNDIYSVSRLSQQ